MPRYANPPPVITKATTPPVDPAQHSAAYKLFHYRYACITAQMNLYSKTYLEISGMVTTGDKEVDAGMAHSKVRVWLTPAAMSHFLEEGASFNLVDPKESVVIYDALNQHLLDWKAHLAREFNPTEVPMDDLRRFEALATEIYQIARGYMGSRSAPLGIFNRPRRVLRGLKKDADIDSVAGKRAIPEAHTPIVDTLRQELQSDAPANDKKRKPWL